MIATQRLPLQVVLSPETTGCDQCLDRLEQQIAELPGIEGLHINRQRRSAILHYDPEVVTPVAIEEAVRQVGSTIGSTYAHHVLPIEGMDCMDCALTLERGIGRLPGVQLASVNFTGARMSVEFDSRRTNLVAIGKRVAELGYRVSEPAGNGTDRSRRQRLLESRANVQTALGALLTLAGGLAGLLDAPTLVATSLYALAILIAGLPIARRGIAAVRATHSLDINVLMMIAVVGAAVIGEWLEAATVVVLFALGEALERYTMDRARRSIRSLMALAPAEAIRKTVDREEIVPVGSLIPGDIVIVRPGERVPVDGTVVAGSSAVNQAPVTGESIPVEKEPNAQVFAGSVNGGGALEIRASRAASDSTIARIIRMVEKAQAQKASSQRFIDVFARYYTPAIVGLAVLVALVPTLLGAAEPLDWLYRALVLLVIACPCALVISTPVSIVSAISAAARSGVLIKGGAHLEAAGALRALAFDKTGTLTRGEPAVETVVPLNGWSREQVLELAAAVERYAEHPLARAIVEAVAIEGISPNGAHIERARSQAGLGASALVDGQQVRVGSRAFVLDETSHLGVESILGEVERAGQTSVLVAVNGSVIGVIGIADRLRPGARAAVAGVKEAGISQTVMLTGDRRAVAEALGSQVGVDAVEAELLPEQKIAAIERLIERHGTVGMVGDGVNDAPALARATVGIAMGAAGTDTALETADIALMSDDLGKVAYTMRLSRRTRRIIAQNIVFALGIKAVFFGLALAGTATLWEAVFADVGASLLVVANGMRLLRERDD